MAMRHGDAQPFAARCPAAGARHVRASPGFVDEPEALGVEIRLAVEPGLAAPQDVWTVLLGGMRGLCLRVQPRRRKNRQSVP